MSEADEETWLLAADTAKTCSRRGSTPGQSLRFSTTTRPLVTQKHSADMFPTDCWLLVLSYLFRPAPTIGTPLNPEEVQEVLRLSHIDTLLRTCVLHLLSDETAPLVLPEMRCISISDEDAEHKSLAEHCLMRPVKSSAARTLSGKAKSAGGLALQVFILVWQFVYIALFLPTTLTLLGLIQPTWKLWTVSVAAICFIPLFYLGFLTSHATLEWWAAINPVGLCPHVNRRKVAHCLHPTPWIRIAVIQLATILISLLLLYISIELGLWLDTRPTSETNYILIFIVVVCYCP